MKYIFSWIIILSLAFLFLIYCLIFGIILFLWHFRIPTQEELFAPGHWLIKDGGTNLMGIALIVMLICLGFSIGHSV